MKAAHISKVRTRAARVQNMLVGGGIEHRELWTNRLAAALRAVRGKDTIGVTNKDLHAAADNLWMLLAQDVPEVLDALLDANRAVYVYRQVIARHGLQAYADEVLMNADADAAPSRAEPLDDLDAISHAVAQISDERIEAHLLSTLERAGYSIKAFQELRKENDDEPSPL